MNRFLPRVKRVLKRFINKGKSVITYPSDRYAYLKKTVKKFTAKDGKYAIVNLDRQLRFDDQCRYLYMIGMYLESSGFKVIIKTSFEDYTGIRKYRFQKFIWKENYIFVRKSFTPKNTITLVQPNSPDRVIHLCYGFSLLHDGKFDCMAPYPMYPSQLKYHSDPSFRPELQNATRRIKVLFSGKTTSDLYASERVKKFFNVHSRLEVVDFILTHFRHCARSLKNEADKLILKQLLESDDYSNDITISEIKSDEEDWLKILSKTDFFICPPGATMPWCHNCVEAISVGAIPILEYADLFQPALQHMKNCLTFKNSDELASAINTALAMGAEEIEELRKNVLDYYNNYLSIESIQNRIHTFANSSIEEVKVAIPFVPTYKERASIPVRVRLR
jgi:hypothetical protein